MSVSLSSTKQGKVLSDRVKYFPELALCYLAVYGAYKVVQVSNLWFTNGTYGTHRDFCSNNGAG